MADFEEIIISGIAGRFPKSRDVEEFSKNLYEKVDMMSEEERRWSHASNPGLLRRMGVVDDIEKFDASFFNVNTKQAERMDPQIRMLLELSYAAILDAGVHPASLNGSNTAVIVANCTNDAMFDVLYKQLPCDQHVVSGGLASMIPNRISFSLGFRGTSMIIDTACCSSLTALQIAVDLIRQGRSDAALVCGTNLMLHPHMAHAFAHVGVLSSDGCSRPFDNKADGYVRSEAIVAIFLQKRKDANRIYANLVHVVGNSDGYKSDGVSHPSGEVQSQLHRQLYADTNINPLDVHYVEAHCTGTIVGDREECYGIEKSFCTNRNEPLQVGSHKSNMGHAEAASGLCSVVKAIKIFETGQIPANLHYYEPRHDIPALMSGRLKVCTETTPFKGSLIAINSSGIGGVNGHLLLRRVDKMKNNAAQSLDDFTRLVIWSGRTELAVRTIFDKLKSSPMNTEFIGLLHNIQKTQINENLHRGYTLLKSTEENPVPHCIKEEVMCFDEVKRPIVWVFSGMGSQWAGMARTLLPITLFRDSIMKCHKVLKQFDVDLMSIITTDDESIFDNILNSFIGITAIQIALVDLLKLIEVPMDHCIGHSMGEIGCAYADGALTLEQAIISSYYRGKCSVDADLIDGLMAAVGLGYNDIKDKLLPNVYVACHNSPTSCTVSGPKNDIKQYVEELKANHIFAKEVNVSGIAYHSKYVAKVGPKMLKCLEKVIPNAKRRSSKWVSTSVPTDQRDTDDAKFSSAKYFVNNLLNAVYFEEACDLLPENAIFIELAPHGLLQSILKNRFKEAIHIPLTHRKYTLQSEHFMMSLGKLFLHNVSIQIGRLYPKVDFPVSLGTPAISPLIKWNHEKDWPIVQNKGDDVSHVQRTFTINLSDDDYKYLAGHAVDGRTILPATLYIYLVWESLAAFNGVNVSMQNVEFENVKFRRATTVQQNTSVKLSVFIDLSNGAFTLSEGKTIVANGYVKSPDSRNEIKITQKTDQGNDSLILQADAFYKELQLRGYNFTGGFLSIHRVRMDGSYGQIKWNNNWITFLDALVQLGIAIKDTRALYLPKSIRRLRINAEEHLKWVQQFGQRADKNVICDAHHSKLFSTITCGGVEMAHVECASVERRKQDGIEVLETYQFVPLFDSSTKYDLHDAVRICSQLALEKLQTNQVKLIEMLSDGCKPIIDYFYEVFQKTPNVHADFTLLTGNSKDVSLQNSIECDSSGLEKHTNCTFVVIHKCMEQTKVLERTQFSLSENGFLISIEDSQLSSENMKVPLGFTLVSMVPSVGKTFAVMQRTPIESDIGKAVVVRIDSSDKRFQWLHEIQKASASNNVFLIAQNDSSSGLLGLINCLRREPDTKHFKCIIIDGEHVPPFTLQNPLYKSQLALKLPINIYRNGQWGTYRHLALKQVIQQQKSADALVARIRHIGDLHSLYWSPSVCYETPNEIVRVQYASVNFRDAMCAIGKLPMEMNAESRFDENASIVGYEFAGVTSTGKRVMGLRLKGGSFSTKILCEKRDVILFGLPDTMTLKDAATIPIVYLTVYMALFINNTLRRGQSILIHAGSGGVGIAAIRVALAYGLNVFTTVSTKEKKEFILKHFPQISENQIGNSRDCSFEQMIMEQTDGEGVHFVLNSLSDEKLHAGIRCLRPHGTFFEIGKFDFFNDSPLGMSVFKRGIAFRPVSVDKIAEMPLELEQAIALITQDLKRGIIQPLPTTVFAADDIENAFRYIATGKHMGKVLLQIRQSENSDFSLPITTIPRIVCDPTLVYVIVGGLGGFGLELADWLVLRGAKYLVLCSRRGVTDSYQQFRINKWKSYGCEVVINTSNLMTFDGCNELFMESLGYGEIGGIFNLAVVLRDGILSNQTVAMYNESLEPKAAVTQHLDTLSRQMCSSLQHFVVFSSLVCGRGNAGQSNYGMANAMMERIIEQRVRDKLPGKAIQWSGIGDVGLIAQMFKGDSTKELLGTWPQRMDGCLNAMDKLLTNEYPIVASMQVALKRTVEKMSLVESVFHILGITDQKTISMRSTLAEIGLDSLMIVEASQVLEREFNINMSRDAIKLLTVRQLYDLSKSNKTKSACVDDAPAENKLFDLLESVGAESTSCDPIYFAPEKIVAPNQPVVLFIPGIEGVVTKAIAGLCKQIAGRVGILQLNNLKTATSIRDLVKSISKDVLGLFEGKTKYYIVAHSYGTILALEIAKLLESNGLTGNLCLIEGHVAMMKQFYSLVNADSTFSVDKCLVHLRSQYLGVNEQEDFKAELMKTKSERRKIDLLLKLLPENDLLKIDLRKIISCIINRCKIFRNYDDRYNVKLRAGVRLLHCELSKPYFKDPENDLKPFTDGKVTTNCLAGNHSTILVNEKLPLIINAMLTK